MGIYFAQEANNQQMLYAQYANSLRQANNAYAFNPYAMPPNGYATPVVPPQYGYPPTTASPYPTPQYLPPQQQQGLPQAPFYNPYHNAPVPNAVMPAPPQQPNLHQGTNPQMPNPNGVVPNAVMPAPPQQPNLPQGTNPQMPNPNGVVPNAVMPAPPQRPNLPGINTPQAPSIATRTGRSANPSIEEENTAMTEYLLHQAKALNAPEEVINGLMYRLNTGNFEVANIDPSKSLNITEEAPHDAKTKHRLLTKAIEEINSSTSPDEAMRKFGILAQEGEVADYDARTQSFITYTTTKIDPKKAKLPDSVERYQVTQNVIRFDAQGRPTVQTRAVNAKEVDRLSQQFELIDPNQTASTFSNDVALKERLKGTLTSPAFQSSFDNAVKTANFNSLDAQAIYNALLPLQNTISATYNTKGVKLGIQGQSPDGGATTALYDPTENTVNIYLPAIEKHLVAGTGKGLTGEALQRYVLAQITATLVHENAHARQFHAIQNPSQFGVNTATDKKTLDSLKLNTQIYNVPIVNMVLKGNMNEYERQPLEAGVKPFEDLAREILLPQYS